MKAALIHAPEQMSIENVLIQDPLENEVTVNVSYVSLCGSDISVYRGHRKINYPQIAGHEAVGIITAVGSEANSHLIGSRVVIEPNIPCYKCKMCKKGKHVYCDEKTVIGLNTLGCFAEFVNIYQRFVHILPSEISNENAALIEPTAVALHAIKKSGASSQTPVAILGLGGIGMLLCHLCVEMGIPVYVTDINKNKLGLAQELGAESLETNLTSQQEQLTTNWAENDIEIIFECVGTAQSPTLAIAAAPKGSKVVLLGLSNKPSEFNALHIVRNGIEIIPSLIYDHPTDFKDVIQMLVNKQIDPSKVITKSIDFNELPNFINSNELKDQAKILIKLP
ncbi:zinc-dependent alcohol dehydrogenase [Jiulongibacter sp. NS-SX5]|uniref:zinc-dependent alcohol dehydrogenase n=1 Tax=Jiulongibacter sp. NS-SX5 TaxID=3463854 RepID=UPI0040597B46